MWANAQRDGRPAKYRRCPLFNAVKFGWRPLLECRAVTLSRSESRWNLLGCPKLTKRSQPLVGRRSCILYGHVEGILLFNIFFPIVNSCLNCENTSRQICAMARRWRFFASFFASCISASRVQHISDLHSKFALGHVMCQSMVDIQSATAEIRPGNKKKKEETTGQKYNVRICYAGRP